MIVTASNMLPAINSPTLAYTLAAATYALNWVEDPMNEIAEGLWVGNIAAAWDNHTLRAKGIDAVVAATQFGDAAAFYPGEFSYYIVTVQDTPESDIHTELARAADFIRAYISTGKKVLVHCNRGKSRSATIAAAYLVSHCGMDATAALELLRRRREIICPNPGFIRQLYSFAEAAARNRSASKASALGEATHAQSPRSESVSGGPFE